MGSAEPQQVAKAQPMGAGQGAASTWGLMVPDLELWREVRDRRKLLCPVGFTPAPKAQEGL